MTTAPRCRTLVLLVGGNPLPNYLAAATLRPARAVLLHSPATASVADRLKKVLQERCGVHSTPWPVGDAASAEAVRQALEALGIGERFGWEGLHLHYTGGTKVMSVHARLALDEHLGGADASYLDEQGALLRFDDGTSEPLQDGLLDLHTVAELHGLQARWKSQLPQVDEEKVRKVLGQRTRDALDEEAIQQFGSRRKKKGNWLEWWVAKLLRESGASEVGAVEKEGAGSTDFQVDVVGLRANRLYVISCTTSLGRDRWVMCRSRVFEVALRARQLGGDLARPALVCLLDEQLTPPHSAEELEHNVRGSWEQAPNQLRVFGLPDARAWAGVDGQPDRSSLEAWLQKYS